jgi:hypothetical protein
VRPLRSAKGERTFAEAQSDLSRGESLSVESAAHPDEGDNLNHVPSFMEIPRKRHRLRDPYDHRCIRQ